MEHRRFFTTSAPKCRLFKHIMRRRTKKVEDIKVGDPIRYLNRPIPEYPPYPYGEATIYKQSDRGLYGGKLIQYGNKVSEFRNKHSRTFKPNVNWNKLWSESLKKLLSIRVAGSVLKTITKEGGLDNYLIKDKPARIKELGAFGWRLRYDVLKKMESKKRHDEPVLEYLDNGTEIVPVYAKFTKSTGEEVNIGVGRNKLFVCLFKALGKDGTIETFRYENKHMSTDEILKKLEEIGYDFEELTVRKNEMTMEKNEMTMEKNEMTMEKN